LAEKIRQYDRGERNLLSAGSVGIRLIGEKGEEEEGRIVGVAGRRKEGGTLCRVLYNGVITETDQLGQETGATREIGGGKLMSNP